MHKRNENRNNTKLQIVRVFERLKSFIANKEKFDGENTLLYF